jgi:hypothetical protein
MVSVQGVLDAQDQAKTEGGIKRWFHESISDFRFWILDSIENRQSKI